MFSQIRKSVKDYTNSKNTGNVPKDGVEEIVSSLFSELEGSQTGRGELLDGLYFKEIEGELFDITIFFQKKTDRVISTVSFFNENIVFLVIVCMDTGYLCLSKNIDSEEMLNVFIYDSHFNRIFYKNIVCVISLYSMKHYMDKNVPFFYENFVDVLELSMDRNCSAWDGITRFMRKYFIEFPEGFPVEEFEDKLYRIRRDPMISGIQMIDIPVETV